MKPDQASGVSPQWLYQPNYNLQADLRESFGREPAVACCQPNFL